MYYTGWTNLFDLTGIQFLPYKIRAASIQQILSPAALTIVAGGSTRVPTMKMIGKASTGKPYMVTINSSPKNPPPGMPLMTVPLKRAMPIAVAMVPAEANGI